MNEPIHPINIDWTNVQQVTAYAQRRYGRGHCVVGPNRRGCYSIIKAANSKEYCKTYKVKVACEILK